MKKVINSEYAYLEDFVNDIPSGTFAYSGKTLHKGRNEVKVFEVLDGRKVVVKRYRQPNFFNRVIYTLFRGSKAERAYRNALKLGELDINTPRPIAYIDVRSWGLLSNSYLITEYTDYAPIQDILNEENIYKVMFADAFIKYTVDLHEKGVRHLDYNPTNILYRKLYDGQFDFMLIDINRMKFGSMSRYKCLSSVKRLCANPDITYFMSQKYAEARGWDVYRSIAVMAILRNTFEKRRHFKKGLKKIALQINRFFMKPRMANI